MSSAATIVGFVLMAFTAVMIFVFHLDIALTRNLGDEDAERPSYWERNGKDDL